MPGYSPSENNVVDPLNSTTALLAPFASYVGQYVDVQAFSSISVAIKSDVPSVFAEVKIEWSTDGINADIVPQRFTFDPFVTSVDNLSIHATVRARYYRVTYQNRELPQTNFVLVSLLRKGTPTGTVRSLDPANTLLTNVDVVSAQAILSGIGRFNPEVIMLPYMDDVNFTTFNREAYLFVSPRPGKEENRNFKKVTASLTPVDLTNFSNERRTFISITNHVERGNLYLQLRTSTGLTTDNFDYIVPPGHTWQDPGQFGSVYAGHIYGVWDEVYIESPSAQPGFSKMVEVFYG